MGLDKTSVWVIKCDNCENRSTPIPDHRNHPGGAPAKWADENGWQYDGEPQGPDLCLSAYQARNNA